MKKIILIIFSLFLLFYTPQAHADSNFATSLNGTYSVATNGITHGTFTVTLKNLTDKYYATTYGLQLGFTDIENLHASDTSGLITPVEKKAADGVEITFPLNYRALGLGADEVLHFSFDTSNVATQNGQIWEVNIPGLQNSSDFSNFSVNVSVPPSFGRPVYEKPDIGGSLNFTKDQLGQSGISLAFGTQQVFHFNLAYHLKDDQVFPVHTDIALPPDTSYQSVSIDSISPKPLQVSQDGDGNWLATYSLLPSQVLTVHVDGRAFLSLTPQKQPDSQSDLAQDLKPSTYWQTNNSKIQSLAHQLQTPYAIYEYVVHTLHYDFARLNDGDQSRLGAVDVLQNPSTAVCLEFTDLFIAIARAAGIPAREIDGYAYTQNSRERPLSLQKDILHAWPQYYDKTRNSWIMVDPTWENTTGGVDYFHTFDFDHIAFVVKGQNPNYPVPAGGYKLSSSDNSQDVVVNFASDVVEPTPITSFTAILPKDFIGGLLDVGDLQVNNTGSVAIPPQSVYITSSIPQFGNQNIVTSVIPPYSTVDIPIQFGKTPFLTNKKGTTTITLAGRHQTYSLEIVPIPNMPIVILGGTLVIILTITLFIIARRPRRVPISG